jgi:hypothetical protein
MIQSRRDAIIVPDEHYLSTVPRASEHGRCLGMSAGGGDLAASAARQIADNRVKSRGAEHPPWHWSRYSLRLISRHDFHILQSAEAA